MALTKNDELAAATGQDKTDHEPICVYDKQMGTYKGTTLTGSSAPSNGTVSPFGSLSSKK